MEIKVLGAHNLETRSTRLPCLVIDGLLALDAGGLTSGLTLEEQGRLEAVLLSHRHYDHVRDIPILCLATFQSGRTLAVYAQEETLETLRTHLLDGAMYPDFTQRPSPALPRLTLAPIEPGKVFDLMGYRVLPLAVGHGAPSVGYHVTSPGGRALFYTGDTGGKLEDCWGPSPLDLLVIEVTLPDGMAQAAQEAGHLTPSALARELVALREAQGSLPPIAVVHMHPAFEEEIRAELKALSAELEASITPAQEGMVLRI